jgi:stage II sporulation protein D
VEYLSPKEGGLPVSRTSSHQMSPDRLRAEVLLAGLFLGATLGLIAFCSAAMASPSPVVRVMVEREKQNIKIEGFDLVFAQGETGKALSHEDRRASVGIRCSLGGKMEVRPTHAKPFTVTGPLHVTSLGGFIRVGTSQYRDDLYVYSFNGDCIVVNHVDLEKYVAGLLNSEMSAKWNSGALMAQAVAARTYALYQMREASTSKYRGLRPPFDLDSSVRDQVYEGAHQERYRTLRAVQDTRGQVLTYAGRPIKAFYHSTCGGRTESAEKVWGARYPYIRPVTCGFCNTSPRFNWTYSMAGAELERRLRAERLIKGSLIGMRIVERNKIGRAEKVEITGSEGVTVVAGTRIRDLAGTVNVKSTDFTLGHQDGKYTFIGNGSGHGVGMCQYGAKTMGDRGRSYAQILKWYYPEAELTKLY